MSTDSQTVQTDHKRAGVHFKAAGDFVAHTLHSLQRDKRTQAISGDKYLSWASTLEDMARDYPDNPAVKSPDGTLSYRELNERANRFAHFLISKKIAKGDIVTVSQSGPTPWWPIAAAARWAPCARSSTPTSGAIPWCTASTSTGAAWCSSARVPGVLQQGETLRGPQEIRALHRGRSRHQPPEREGRYFEYHRRHAGHEPAHNGDHLDEGPHSLRVHLGNHRRPAQGGGDHQQAHPLGHVLVQPRGHADTSASYRVRSAALLSHQRPHRGMACGPVQRRRRGAAAQVQRQQVPGGRAQFQG